MKTLIFILLLAPIASVAQDFSRIEQQILKELNERRAEKRRKPVTYDAKYQEYTDKWAIRLVTKYEHATNSHYYGEVIGPFMVEELILDGFFRSDGHRAVLMDKDIDHVCLSIYVVPAYEIKLKGGGITSVPTTYNTVIRTYRKGLIYQKG